MFCVIIGKTTSGKTTVVKKLNSLHGYKQIVTYTTRPIRPGEEQGVTYHYISTTEFQEKIAEGFFAEWKTYDTEFGVWYYGTALEDLEKADDNTVIILTPDGYRDVVDKLSTKPKSIYLYANNATIKKRLQARGDDKNEAERRLEHDNADFKGIENEVDKIFYNNEGTDIDEVVNKIVIWIEGEK
jgi:guanylate kinase